jgi:hypothetical protein
MQLRNTFFMWKFFYCQLWKWLGKIAEKNKNAVSINKKKLVWPESPVALIIHISAGWSDGNVNIVSNGKTALFEGLHIIWPAFSWDGGTYFTSRHA